MNLFDIAVFGTGVVCGIYMGQTYKLPQMEIIFKNVVKYLKYYEPEKKDNMGMDLD